MGHDSIKLITSKNCLERSTSAKNEKMNTVMATLHQKGLWVEKSWHSPFLEVSYVCMLIARERKSRHKEILEETVPWELKTNRRAKLKFWNWPWYRPPSATWWFGRRANLVKRFWTYEVDSSLVTRIFQGVFSDMDCPHFLWAQVMHFAWWILLVKVWKTEDKDSEHSVQHIPCQSHLRTS